MPGKKVERFSSLELMKLGLNFFPPEYLTDYPDLVLIALDRDDLPQQHRKGLINWLADLCIVCLEEQGYAVLKLNNGLHLVRLVEAQILKGEKYGRT